LRKLSDGIDSDLKKLGLDPAKASKTAIDSKMNKENKHKEPA
jgi:hypothetical protein